MLTFKIQSHRLRLKDNLLKLKYSETDTLLEFAIIFAKQFSVREIIGAKSSEPGGGCNVERSRMRRARH